MTLKRALLAALVAAVAALAVHALHGRGPGRSGGGPRQPFAGHTQRTPVDWPTYGFDSARTHAAPFALAPPFRVVWKQTGDWSLIEFPPIVVDGRLYVGTNHGLVVALDSASGRVIWRRELGRCVASSPALAAGLVLVGVMASPPHCDEDVPSYLVALDARTGRTRWLYRSGGPVETSPLVAGDLVVFGSWDGRVDAVDTLGRLRWSFQTNAAVKAGAALWHSTVYAGSYDGFVYALDARSGRLRWRAAAGGRFYATPSVDEGRVIAATTDGVVHAFAAGSGAPLWSRRIGRFAYSARLRRLVRPPPVRPRCADRAGHLDGRGAGPGLGSPDRARRPRVLLDLRFVLELRVEPEGSPDVCRRRGDGRAQMAFPRR